MSHFYEIQLGLLIGLCAFTLLLDRYVSRRRKQQSIAFTGEELGTESEENARVVAGAALTKQYLIVFAFISGGNWLQGPYLYSLYKDQYGCPERIIAILYVTGHLSGGFSAPLIGVWADQHGRKTFSLVYCITYASECACILVPWLPILFLGRMLGGMSSTVALEAWLISSASAADLSPSDLSTIMGWASLVDGFIATGAGVVSNHLVTWSGSFATPFMFSGILLVIAWVVIRYTWTENYGAGGGNRKVPGQDRDIFQLKRLRQGWSIVRKDPLLLVLAFSQTCFEGVLNLFIFNWVPSLQEASATPTVALPLGYIFAGFMVSLMLGSLIYNLLIATLLLNPAPTASLKLHAKLSSSIFAISALALAGSILSSSERVRFYAFCVFEVCVGIYNPVKGMLHGTLISNEHRATVTSLIHVPLNIFVVITLITGVSSARYAVLGAGSILLAFSSIFTGVIIVRRADIVVTADAVDSIPLEYTQL